ncbi:MAG TPA: ATP-binding protein [Longimicrobiales bacterium]
MTRAEKPSPGRRRRTERIEAEQFRLLVESVVDYAIFMLDPEGRISTWNRGAQHIKGYTADEILGKHFSVLYTERDRLRNRPEEVLRIAAREGRFEEEGPRRRKDGSVFPAHVTITALRDDAGRLIGFAKVTRDLSDRKSRRQATRFLAEASRILATSLDYEETIPRVARFLVPAVADWCTVDLRENGAIRRIGSAHVNPAKERLVRELAQRYPPDPDTPISVARVIETGRPELLPEIPDERLRETARDEAHLRLLRDLAPRSALAVPLVARGEVLGAITLVTSESRRRYDEDDLTFAAALADRIAIAVDTARLIAQSEEARGEAERRAREESALRQAVGAVTESFTVADVIHRIAESAVQATNADGTAVERIHLDTDEIEVVAVAGKVALPLGERLRFHGSLAEQVTERGKPLLIESLAETREPVPAHWPETCADCSLLVLPLVDSGEAIGALILLRTREKHVFREDEIGRAVAFAYLAALAFRRVHLLEESEQRREELLEVLESRSRLMRGFSHDVKNPVGAAGGFLELLADGTLGDLTEKQMEGITRARRAIDRALRLIDDLLELARAEAGQIDIRPQPIELREAIHEMVEEYRAPAEAKGLAVEYHLPEALPVIESDVGRIRQILGNLLSNAVKYTDRGGITVRVEIRENGRAPRPGRWVGIAITDTGPGIPEDKQELLFQEFKRITPGAERGAGLGLAISRRVARALNGDVTAESAPGRGSTFTLWLSLE